MWFASDPSAAGATEEPSGAEQISVLVGFSAVSETVNLVMAHAMKLASSLSSGFLGVGEEWPTLVFLWDPLHDESIAPPLLRRCPATSGQSWETFPGPKY